MSKKKKTDSADKVQSVEVTIDGEKHAVRCSMGVLIRYQVLTGKNAFRKEDMVGMGPLEYVQFLACALYKENIEERVQELSEKVDNSCMDMVTEIIRKIFNQGFGDDEEENTAEGAGLPKKNGLMQTGQELSAPVTG